MGKKPINLFEDVDIKGAARLSGLTIMMVSYLDRSDVLVPTWPKERGHGRKRRYTFGDVVMLRILASLLKSGISVARLKNALIAFRKHHPEITPKSLPSRYLVSDGIRVYLRNKKEVFETLDDEGQMTFAFVVELYRIRREVLEMYNAPSSPAA